MKKIWIYRIFSYLILTCSFFEGCTDCSPRLDKIKLLLQVEVTEPEASILELTLIKSHSLGADNKLYPFVSKLSLGNLPSEGNNFRIEGNNFRIEGNNFRIEGNKKATLKFRNFDIDYSQSSLIEYKIFTLNHSSLIAKGYFRNCGNEDRASYCPRNSLDHINVSRDWFAKSVFNDPENADDPDKERTLFKTSILVLENESLRWSREPQSLRIFNNPSFFSNHSNFSGGDYKVISYELDDNLTTIVKSLELVVPKDEVRTIYTLDPQNEIPMSFRIVNPSNNEILYEALVKDYPFGIIRTPSLSNRNSSATNPIDWQWRTNVSTTILSKSLQTDASHEFYTVFPP